MFCILKFKWFYMKFTAFTALFFILTLCINAQDNSNLTDKWQDKRAAGIEFTAAGYDPVWSIDIDIDGKVLALRFVQQLSGLKDSLEFTNLSESMIMGSPVTIYNASGSEQEVTIEVTKDECIDNNSGEASPYYVKVRRKQGKNIYTYVGCGRYLADYRLSGKWSIEKINNKSASDYRLSSGKTPVMELSISDERFTGYAGCNRFFGSFEAKGSRLTFGKTASTLMVCQDAAMERDLYEVIDDKTYEFKIDGSSLSLMDKKGVVFLELRKAE